MSAAPRGPRLTRHTETWIAYGLTGYFAYMESVLGPLMPFLRAERGFDYTLASLHFSAFAGGAVLAGLVSDRLAAGMGRARAIWSGAAGMALGAALLASGPAAAYTIAGTLIMGSCGAVTLVGVQAALADRHREWSAAAITESNILASACGIGAALAVALFSATSAGWRAALFLPAFPLAVAGLRWGARPLGEAAARSGGASALPPGFWLYWAVVFLGVSVEWCVAYWAADFLARAGGFDRSVAAGLVGVFFAAMLLGRWASSRLTLRVRSATLLVASLTLACAGFGLFWSAATPAVALTGLFLVGLGVASVYPLGVSLAVNASEGGADLATARLGIAGGAAVLLAPFGLGALADRIGVTAAFGVVVPLLLAALALAFVARARVSEAAPASGV